MKTSIVLLLLFILTLFLSPLNLKIDFSPDKDIQCIINIDVCNKSAPLLSSNIDTSVIHEQALELTDVSINGQFYGESLTFNHFLIPFVKDKPPRA